MINLLEEKVTLLENKAKSEAVCEEDPNQLLSSADNNDNSDEPVYRTHTKKLILHSLSQLSGSNEQDGDAFDRWVCKLSRCIEFESWTDRQKLLQLELHLVGRAKQTYELLNFFLLNLITHT